MSRLVGNRRALLSGGTVPVVQTFGLLLADAGSGVVTTTLALGTGSATFTRATTAAARLSTGLWNLGVASGSPRSHYDPAGVYLGYLAEQAATQLILDPRDMTTANWTLGATLTRAKTANGMDGSANAATTLTGGAVQATNTILQTVTAAASTRTYSCHIKRRTGTGVVEITQDGGSTWADITAQIGASVFQLCQVSQSQLNAQMGLRIATNGDQIDVDCNQFEAGQTATTPIPSGGTRNNDVLTYPIAGNFSNTKGSAFAQVWLDHASSTPVTSGAFANVFGDSGGSGSELVFFTNAGRPAMYDGTTTPSIVTTVAAATSAKLASSWSVATTQSIYINGGSKVTGAFDGSMSVVTFGVGNNNGVGGYLNGCVQNIKIWNGVLSDAAIALL